MRNDPVWVSPISYSFAFENSGVKFMQEFYILAKLSPLLSFYQGNSRKPQLGKLLRRTWCSKSFHYQYLSTIGSNSRAMPIWAFHIKNVFQHLGFWDWCPWFSALCVCWFITEHRTQLGRFGLFSDAIVPSAYVGNFFFLSNTLLKKCFISDFLHKVSSANSSDTLKSFGGCTRNNIRQLWN